MVELGPDDNGRRNGRHFIGLIELGRRPEKWTAKIELAPKVKSVSRNQEEQSDERATRHRLPL
jgi:hypothetical protein